MDNNKRKKLLNDLCYVDADLKITEDVDKAVGFVDIIFDTDSDVHYVINFFECIGTAQSGKEAFNLIKNWLFERYGHHYLAEFLFEPIIPLVTSIGLCNENEPLHGKCMADCWLQIPFVGRINFANYERKNSFQESSLWEDALPIKDGVKFTENQIDELVIVPNDYLDLPNEEVKVFPSVIVGREFSHRGNLKITAFNTYYSLTIKIQGYNLAQEMYYCQKERFRPVACVIAKK